MLFDPVGPVLREPPQGVFFQDGFGQVGHEFTIADFFRNMECRVRFALASR